MALAPIKTSAGTGFCDCICGCYNLVSLRDEVTGKSYCPACAKEHLDMNAGLGIPNPAPSHSEAARQRGATPAVPAPADPPGRLRG
jgi:hypothetical protein